LCFPGDFLYDNIGILPLAHSRYFYLWAEGNVVCSDEDSKNNAEAIDIGKQGDF